MFEERFGRTITSILLAVIGIAILAWGMQTTVAFAVYIYKLTLKANLVPQLEAESILKSAIRTPHTIEPILANGQSLLIGATRFILTTKEENN